MAHSFEHQIINGNTSYWKFYKDATPETYQAAFNQFVRDIKKSGVNQLVVVVQQQSSWDQSIEHLWMETGKLADEHGILYWGIAAPDSAIWQMTMQRLANGGSFIKTRNYDLKICQDENEILSWLGLKQAS